MKITHSFKAHSLVLAAALVAGLGIATQAAARQASYLIDLSSRTAIQLGNLGGDYTAANAINDAGQVVGNASTSRGDGRAFITGSDGVGMRDLGTLGGNYVYVEASGINNAGQVVGYSSTSDTPHAFITGPNGTGMRDLGRLGGDSSYATGINDAGQVVGFFTPHFALSVLSSPAPMARIPRTSIRCSICRMALFFTTRSPSITPVRWQGSPQCPAPPCMRSSPGPPGAGLRDLGTLGGNFFSTVAGINDAGQVVGQSTTVAGAWHAFITGPDGVGMSDLSALAMDYSVARGVNDAGQVVGMSYMGADSPHAFITGPDGKGMMDLNSVVNLPRGVILTEATDINNVGQVIALGVPEPESYAMFLAGMGLIGFMASRKRLIGLNTP